MLSLLKRLRAGTLSKYTRIRRRISAQISLRLCSFVVPFRSIVVDPFATVEQCIYQFRTRYMRVSCISYPHPSVRSPCRRIVSFPDVLERGKTDIMPDKMAFLEIRGWSPRYSRGSDFEAEIPASTITMCASLIISLYAKNNIASRRQITNAKYPKL